MPIKVEHPIRMMSQEQFGNVAFDVLGHSFDIHSKLGRFFDERVYHCELARRLGCRATSEVWIHASHAGFDKPYRIDLLVDDGAIFEIKTVSAFHDHHRSQLIYYLFMTGLRHGKLINFRRDNVLHEFVNVSATLEERQAFGVQLTRWDQADSSGRSFQQILLNCLRDWGTGLDIQLYDEALIHFFGGKEMIERDIAIIVDGRQIGCHSAHLLNTQTAFKLTSRNENLGAYESHLRKFIRHTNLDCIYWVNITLHEVVFVIITKGE